MRPAHQPDNSRHSHDAKNANTTKNARKSNRGFMKRPRMLLVALLAFGVLAAGFVVVSGRAAALGIHLPASVTKIFARSETASTAPAPRTVSEPAMKPLAPTAITLSWNTNGNAGTETTEPSTTNDPNVSSANLTLGAGVTAAANGNRFGGTAWFDAGDTNPTTLAESIAGNDYIQFIVTPNAGFTFTPTSLVFTWDRSGTGPSSVTLRSSADGFSGDLGSVTGIVAAAFASNTIPISGLTNLNTATTFRLYGYGGTAAAGTGGFDTNVAGDNVVLNGTTAATATPPKYRSRQNGNWNDFNTWQIDTGGGFVDATSGQTPTSADDTIQIQTTHGVTVSASVSADQVTVDSGGTLQVNPGQTLTIADGTGTDLNVNGTVAVAGTVANSGQVLINNLLRVNGNPGGSVTGNALTYGASSTLEYSASGASQTTTSTEFPGSSGPTNVTIGNGSGVTLHAARTITGTLDLQSGNFATAGLLSMANGSQITKSDGNMTGTPAGAGTYNVVYSGMLKGTTSELAGAGLTNVTVDMNPSQLLILDMNRTVPGTLALTGGMVSTGSFTLIANGNVTRNVGMVVGNLQRRFTATGPLTFDIGTISEVYSPVVVNATAGTFPAQFTVSATGTAMPGISGPNKLNRFWTLTNTTVSSANLTFNYPATDVVGNVANYQFVRKTGGILTILPPSGTPTSTSATINGVTTFSDWTLAEPSSVTTTFVVNNNGDTGDVTPGNGICETGTGNGICTLRAAVQEANATSSPVDINFNIGSSTITVGSELPLNHTMNINGPTGFAVTVAGSGAVPTRVFHTFRLSPATISVSISNLTVTGGRASLGGGLLAEGPLSSTTLTGMLFTGNTAVDSSGLFGGGGAASINGGALDVRNSTFSGNTGTNGGGIALSGAGPINLVNVTVTLNTADGNNGTVTCGVDGDGGGVAGLTMPASNLNLRNTIVAGNQDCNSNNPNVSGGFNNQGNNFLTGNALLGPLQDNGGPTFTHGLLNLSPAIDAGNDCVFNNTCSPSLGVALTTDQRGGSFTRRADGDTVPGLQVDIGAFEKQIPSAASGAISGRILDHSGNPVAGAAVRLSGTQNRLMVTDAAGSYRFADVGTGGFYTVTPVRANYTFAPAQRSFSQLGEHTDAGFTASPTGGPLSPLDTTEFFVRQQYLDFLGREPDEAGLNFWVNNIQDCGNHADCRAAKRIDTSAAFFLSIEFQQTGYLVYRTYRSAYGDMAGAPVPLRLGEFKPDTAKIGNGVIVNQTGWEALLETNKQAYMAEFVQRLRFVSAYPETMTPGEFVDRLFATAGVIPADSDRTAAVQEFGSAATSSDQAARGRALRKVAENSALAQQEFNRAFVLMQYFGYLRRDANSGPDTDFAGYNFWLEKLEAFNGNFRDAEMVKAFLVSSEYLGRFPR